MLPTEAEEALFGAELPPNSRQQQVCTEALENVHPIYSEKMDVSESFSHLNLTAEVGEEERQKSSKGDPANENCDYSAIKSIGGAIAKGAEKKRGFANFPSILPSPR